MNCQTQILLGIYHKVNIQRNTYGWVHLCAVKDGVKTSDKNLPDETIFDNQRIIKSEDIAQNLNINFPSVKSILYDSDTDVPELNTE